MNQLPTKPKYSILRVAKHQLYKILKGDVITRRDVLTASAAGATGIAIERMFGWGINFSAKQAGEIATSVTKPEIVDARKSQQSTKKLGRYVYLTPEKLGGGTHAVDLETG